MTKTSCPRNVRIPARLAVALLLSGSAALGAAQAAPPSLGFSDLVNGPRAGNGDGQAADHGAIVTVWGNNLGSAQGTSKIYVGDPGGTSVEAAHYYYWRNADGTLPGGPADLYDSHRMQEVAFSIPTTAPIGNHKIWAVVGGVTSNPLYFNVTSSGYIYFVKPSGSDGNPGTWSQPWLTLNLPFGDSGTVTPAPAAGDIVYFVGTTGAGAACRSRNGAAGNLVAFVAYPGTSVTSTSGMGGNNYSDECTYVLLSKLSAKDDEAAFSAMPHSRLVGNAATQISCAEGGAGAFYGWQHEMEGTVMLGNYVHDFGCSTTSNQEHATYFTGRKFISSDDGAGPFVLTAPFEIGWFHLRDNTARMGIHVYDEHGCFSIHGGPVLIHDNVVVDQVQDCINVVVGWCYDSYRMDAQTEVDVYDNLCVNTGISGGTSGPSEAIWFGGDGNYGTMKAFNNTIYGYSERGCTDASCVALNLGWYNTTFPGIVEWKNNVVVDTQGLPFFNAYFAANPTGGSNLWWDSGGAVAAPPWDSSPITSDPLFVNAGAGDFTLQSTSPARDTGVDLSPLVTRDLRGTSRPQGTAYDIGAFEYFAACAGTDVSPCTTPPSCHTATGATCSGGDCQYPPAAAGTVCEDGDVCTEQSTCDGSGACVPGARVAGCCASDVECAPYACQNHRCCQDSDCGNGTGNGSGHRSGCGCGGDGLGSPLLLLIGLTAWRRATRRSARSPR